jgi:hypothetical protein
MSQNVFHNVINNHIKNRKKNLINSIFIVLIKILF